jgi:hypothetical protein
MPLFAAGGTRLDGDRPILQSLFAWIHKWYFPCIIRCTLTNL